jgi:hypothetical protein
LYGSKSVHLSVDAKPVQVADDRANTRRSVLVSYLTKSHCRHQPLTMRVTDELTESAENRGRMEGDEAETKRGQAPMDNDRVAQDEGQNSLRARHAFVFRRPFCCCNWRRVHTASSVGGFWARASVRVCRQTATTDRPQTSVRAQQGGTGPVKLATASRDPSRPPAMRTRPTDQVVSSSDSIELRRRRKR